MRFQRPLVAIALLLTTATSVFASVSAEQKRERLRLLRTDEFRRMNLSPVDRAYLDVRTLLVQQGPCSEFFRGSKAATVLEELLVELREERFSNTRIGVRMSGSVTFFDDSEKGVSYRLFEIAKLNTQGPFYRAKVFAADPYVPAVGSFAPNTREVRALILLHELAHLVQGKDRTWLIPDDGENSQLSRLNTSTVESKCGRQIRGL